MVDITSEIIENFVSIPSDTQGYSLELNLVSWNKREPKYDLRKWNEDHTRSGKGITLSEDEVVLLFQKKDEILKRILKIDEESHTEKDEVDDVDVYIPFT